MARRPKAGSITSGFGYRINPITGVRKLHAGADIGGTGTIVAPLSMTVTQKGQNLNKTSGYGNWLRARDAFGFYHLFAHMASPSARVVGEKLSEGATIGSAGHTGAATGDHLHYGVSTGIEIGWIDPIAYIDGKIAAGPGGSSGSTGSSSAVRNWAGIQRMLHALYGYNGIIDGIPGPLTWKAMQRFLKANWQYTGPVDGIPGINTWKAIQRWLKAKYGYTGLIDGKPGPLTNGAFNKANAANGAVY